MTMDESREQNLKSWESRVSVHAASKMYDLDGIVSGAKQYSDIFAFDVEPLGDVSGLDAVHLQCHIGTDTVSLARLGARVTGLDFSPAALEVARDLAARCGVDARFVEAELYRAVDALGREQFDLVYTGVGSLGWLPDITGWARVVAELLRPGGRLYLREGHPMLWALDPDRDDQLLVVGYPYFETEEPEVFDFPGTYTDGDASGVETVSHEWNHGLGEIVQAVLEAGLTLTRLVEHDFAEWKALDWMAVDDKGHWRLPDHRERLPVMYTLEARK
jgi:SAM-dependent methyltransferase